MRKILFSHLTKRESLIVAPFPNRNRLHYPLLERDAWNKGMCNRGGAIKIFWDQCDRYLKEGERLLEKNHEIIPNETKFKMGW